MSVAHALTVQGWMDQGELEWLAANAAGRGLVVEFGAWCGRSSIALASAKNVLCVDTWKGSDEAEHASLIASGLDPWGEWHRNLSDYPHVLPWRLDLADDHGVELLCGMFGSEGVAGMVFVDASHDYASVRRDIATARRLLKPAGLLCGHDYADCWPGVKQAVDELVPGRSLHRSIWWAFE